MIYPANKDTLKYAVPLLLDGEVIVYPTDTLYGFGVDATNTESVNKLNALKGRTQPLSIILENIRDIINYGIIKSNFKKNISKLFPGPYTILIPKSESDLSPLVTYGSQNIGIRIPDHPFPVKLVEKLKRPIITTSINRHGNEPLNDISQVELDFPDIAIFEDNIIKKSVGSTIIDFSKNPPEIIRKGDGKYPL